VKGLPTWQQIKGLLHALSLKHVVPWPPVHAEKQSKPADTSRNPYKALMCMSGASIAHRFAGGHVADSIAA
jgi:hypothetical protein